MDVVAAVRVVDQLGGGGVILIGTHAVKSAAGVVLEGLRHLGGGLLHERDLGVVGVFRVVGAIAPRVEDGLDAGVQRDEGVYVVRVQKPLQRLDLRLGGGGGAGGGPVHIADLLAVLRLDVIPVPLEIEGAVHVDPAGARIVAEHAVFIPVRALHAEDGEIPRRRVVRLAAIERGDEAVAVDVRVGIAEGDVVAVCVLRAQVRAGVDDEGLLIAVRVDDRDDIDRVGVEQTLDIGVVRAERQPPGGVHGRGGAFALAAVDVGEDTDPCFLLGRDRLVGDLQAPEIALLPGGADGIEVGDVGILFGHLGELRFQLCEGVARVPVDVQPLRGPAGRVGAGIERQPLRFFAARRAAGGKTKYEDQGKTEVQGPFGERFHVGFSFLSGLQAERSAAAGKPVSFLHVLLY